MPYTRMKSALDYAARVRRYRHNVTLAYDPTGLSGSFSYTGGI